MKLRSGTAYRFLVHSARGERPEGASFYHVGVEAQRRSEQRKGGVMFRLMFSMLMWVTVARWVYSEVELSAPVLIPVFDSILEVVQIPTHDQWSADPFKAVLAGMREVLNEGGELFTPVSDVEVPEALVERNYEVF
jgi:hypothetical protein